MLQLARVVAIHPESHSVDIVLCDDGRRFANAQVMSSSAGGNFGLTDLSTPDLTSSNPYETLGTNTRDIFGIIGWANYMPVVLGFMFPQVAQCLFEDKDRMIYRHSSDVYLTIDKSGNAELFHPSGTYLRIGEAQAHEDLTAKDYDKRWKIERNTDKAVHVHLSVKNAGSEVASLNIDPDGNIDEHNIGNLTAAIDGSASVTVGGDLDVDVAGSISATAGGPASVTSGVSITLSAPTIVLDGNVTASGSLGVQSVITAGQKITAPHIEADSFDIN